MAPVWGLGQCLRDLAAGVRRVDLLVDDADVDGRIHPACETLVLGGQLFVRAMGVLEPSSRLDVILRDQTAGLGEVVRVVEETGSRISSVMTLAMPSGEREVVLRLATINPGPAVRALEAKGYVVRDTDRGVHTAP